MQKVLTQFFPSSQLCGKFSCSTQELVALKAGRIDPDSCMETLKEYLPTDEDIIVDETIAEPVEEETSAEPAEVIPETAPEVPETEPVVEEKAPDEEENS